MYQCPRCGTMSLEPTCEWCGPFEDKTKTKEELDKIYGFKSKSAEETKKGRKS